MLTTVQIEARTTGPIIMTPGVPFSQPASTARLGARMKSAMRHMPFNASSSGRMFNRKVQSVGTKTSAGDDAMKVVVVQ
jgi:hypothetical protein